MRNDARPIGEDSPASPLGGDQGVGNTESSVDPSERLDSRDSVTHDRQSHIVNPRAEEREPSGPDDPVMPQNDATLNTRI
jgi:hypothetical protein